MAQSRSDLFGPLLPSSIPPLHGIYYIGTSGYLFDDWFGTVYPQYVNTKNALSYYLKECNFSTLELNVTFYRMPTAKMLQRFARDTPDKYPIALKVYKDVTHANHPFPPEKTISEFLDAAACLRDAGKCAAFLLQFPYAFHNTRANRHYITACRSCFGDAPLTIEFRHNSWHTKETVSLFHDNNIAWCCVDEPSISRLMPNEMYETASFSYIRLHGRNTQWFTAGESDRYDYDYSIEELESLLSRIHACVSGTHPVLIFFNNCHMGHAVKNARTFLSLVESNT